MKGWETLMIKFLAIATLLISASFAQAQTDGPGANEEEEKKPSCTLKLAQAPHIGGLKLGMTTEEVLALFPGSRDDAEVRAALARPANAFGVTNFAIRPEKYASKAKFAGISQINLALLDGRISNFYVGYNGAEWKHVDDFVTKFSEGTSLPPPDLWEAFVGMDDKLKTLKCQEFEISIFAGGKGGQVNYVKMNDVAALKKLKERRTKAKDAKPAQP
jgi:hypothetical protein